MTEREKNHIYMITIRNALYIRYTQEKKTYVGV
jgi:hypothetical protein